jgi:integrase
MSVRKRQWFTNRQVQEWSRRLAKAAGTPEDVWPKFYDAARNELNKLLRDSREKDGAHAREKLGRFPPQECWIVDYADQHGERHIKTFERKKEADEHHAAVKVDVKRGTHTAPNKSVTVSEAALDWLAYVEAEGRERTTREQYSQHVRLHIVPELGKVKLANLSTPKVEKFRDDLLARLSRPMARKVLVSFKALLKDAKRRGNVAQNAAADTTIKSDKRSKRKVEAGREFPLTTEVKIMIDAVQGRRRAVLVVAALAGLRASEIRGLLWRDVDFKRGLLHVRQRADRYGTIGNPKSEAGEREVPVGPLVINTLREWRLQSGGDLVFANAAGKPEDHSNLVQRVLHRAQIDAGLVDKDGAPKYPGMYCLRHYYASWLITRKQDGGHELPLKDVQSRLGHATLAMTADTYGHLFPRSDHKAESAEAEQRAGFA